MIILLALSLGLFAKVPATSLVNDKIQFEDDLDFKNMVKAIDRHLVYFNNRKYMHVKFKLAGTEYKREDLKSSLVEFKKLVNKALACTKVLDKSECMLSFSDSINEKFSIYKPIPNKDELGFDKNMSRFTAYYSPSLKGSKVKTDIYKNPIYKKPLKSAHQNYTREQIEFEAKLANKGLELFYVKESLLDIWLLHVEGGGLIEEEVAGEAPKLHYLSYNGTNKRKFSMLSRYMLDNGMLTEDNRSVRAQREYIESNPEQEREIISSCQSYVYFKTTKSEPLGVRNIPLTMNRSLASDKDLFNEYGFISFIQIKKDDSVEKSSPDLNVNRFFINQDTGGSINGAARGDLYMGYGDDAKFYANNLHALGNQYLIILKK